MAMRFFNWRPIIDGKEEKGSVLPFLAVLLLLMVLVAFFGMGTTKLYLDRTLVRDALDAGTAAALAPARVVQKKYHFGSHLVSDEDGDTSCEPFEYTRPVISRVDPKEAEALARQYFHANMLAHGLTYELLEFKLKILYEDRMMDVIYETCEGDYDQWQENFPRWARVSVEARVKMPVQMGEAFNMKEVTAAFKSEYKRKI